MSYMNILGISAFYHDSAACLVKDGEIMSAAQEERFTRVKHDHSFPAHAVNFCLQDNGITIRDIDLVVFYEKPFLKFERICETYLQYTPLGIKTFLKAMPLWIKQKLWIKDIIANDLGYQGKIIFTEHHEAHAASAFFPSPFHRAAFITTDGVGEWTTTSYGIGKNNTISILADIQFPHSLGLLYSAFTYFCGFRVNSGEYKLMGLAPYGEPKYKDIILQELIDLKEDGSFRLNMKYFNFGIGLKMTNNKFYKLFKAPPRDPEGEILEIYMDAARSIQEVIEIAMLKIARHVKTITKEKNLCLAGGVALNCVANGKILREKIFDNIWIQPASGDAGGALGAALFAWHQYLGNSRPSDEIHDKQKGSFLGPKFPESYIEKFLQEKNIPHTKLKQEEVPKIAAGLIAKQKVIGWLCGKMEYGPRALGARSILGDARSSQMQEIMNMKIKFRESFRPFAPSVLIEKCAEYFDIKTESPYMLFVADVKQEKRKVVPKDNIPSGIGKLKILRSEIPAVTHVDYSARVQTVHKETNPLYYEIIKEFEKLTGCPVIINTSFNVRGEPIVCSPEEAFACFMKTNMDCLFLENFLLDKSQMPKTERHYTQKATSGLD